MDENTRNRTLALSALFLCVHGVTQIANTGQCKPQLLSTCIGSLIHGNSDNIEDIYGGLEHLEDGLSALIYNLGAGQLSPDGRPKNMESTRYSINILHLQRKLMKNKKVYNNLMSGIKDAQSKLEFFDLTHPNIIANLAETYSETISQLAPRIMIKGNQTYLGNPDNASKIRALLLAAIRAALLWDQAGGSRWKLLFERSKMQKEAEQLFTQIKSSKSEKSNG